MGFYDDLNSDPLAPKPPDYFYPAYGPDNNPLAGVVMPENHPLAGIVSPDQYPDLSTASTTAFRQPGATPAIPTSPLSQPAYEPAQKLPAQGMWGNWLDNLATSLATTPLQAPNNFGGGLLSGFAKGFSTARLGKMSEREKLQKAMDDYAAKRNEANIKATTDAAAARQKRLEDLRADIDKRRRDRDDLLYKTMLEASVKANADGTFTLTEPEAKAMGAGYTAGQTVPKEIKVEALARTRPDKGGKGGPAGPELSDYTTLLTKVQGDNDIQRFQVVRDSWASMQNAPVSGPGDISLIYSFMRINDPGSTVREGEFATAENAGGVPAQIRNLYNKVVSGQRLDISTRNEFMKTAQTIYRSRLPQYGRAVQQYTNLAKAYGLNPSLVVRDYSTDDPDYKPLFDPKSASKGSGGNVTVRYKGDSRTFVISRSRLPEALAQGNIEEAK